MVALGHWVLLRSLGRFLGYCVYALLNLVERLRAVSRSSFYFHAHEISCRLVHVFAKPLPRMRVLRFTSRHPLALAFSVLVFRRPFSYLRNYITLPVSMMGRIHSRVNRHCQC